MENTQNIELSRPVRIKDLKKRVTHIDIEASPEELQALATRFGLPGISELGAKVKVERLARDRAVRIEGTISAQLSYRSVVSLEPFDAVIEESFSEILSGEVALETDTEIELTPDDENMGVIEDGGFDLGEVLSQNLALLLEEHPRKPEETDAPDGVIWADKDAEEAEQNPFLVLSEMRDRLRNGD
ncbi:YceD family protein [Nisaea nitritireducens]|uniref:YceD family protein n=1 Tax=Nisaea nitritireducens TaxID=568392 RepID=UPI001868ED51|nr:YceD family protein [Nisaea nitritireducens]